MRSALLAAVVLLVAGCVSSAPDEAPAAGAAPQVAVDADRPDPSYGEIALGPAAAADEAATLLAAPRLQVGEWWKIKMMSPIDGRTAEYVRVVADVDGDVYVFGMPHEGWYKEAVVYHVPFFGDVYVEDLSGHAHDVPFKPLQFPLTDQTSWVTHFMQSNVELTTTVKTDQAAQTADITFTDANGNVVVEITYDARQHEMTRFKHATIEYEVVEHGYGFEGWVTVPRGEDLIFLHGRAFGVFGFDPESNGPDPVPTETVDVAGGFNRMSFILVTGGAVPDPNLAPAAGLGAHSIRATDPAGNTYELGNVPSTSNGVSIEFFEARDPDGTWTIDYTNLGTGFAFLEGIAYHQYDILVPTGERRADHSHEVIR